MFNEQAYLQAYPKVKAAVNAGFFSSGLQHYQQFGQSDPEYFGFFLGTNANDTITGFGNNKLIAGLGLEVLANPDTVAGVGQIDTLIGTQGRDVFLLGHPTLTSLAPTPKQFYVGGGDTDYALIQNFDQGDDIIVLKGSPQNYTSQVVNGSLNISTSSGDLVGIVQGVPLLLKFSGGVIDLAQFGIPFNAVGEFCVFL
ncbi:hypothetical protein H6G76_21325 [Nostoc sp. FACHB-152]|uniref:hypothetical protein n=1 Tax=unclassified Nostoc TaxID=2593658 RepID=UPI00168A2E6D|nr:MULTISPECIES: hypothetical protein [unclassified Nostoc]MBD2449662.1 hypothetical protein [Nostoc sp. FACHB-152]MBD2469674.1 hypothetical protein [Nostoc sp. FACHB-145]